MFKVTLWTGYQSASNKQHNNKNQPSTASTASTQYLQFSCGNNIYRSDSIHL